MLMPHADLAATANTYLDRLCTRIDSRRVGSAGNRAATGFFAETAASFGFEVTTPSFDCIDLSLGTASLTIDGSPFAVRPSPYSLGCDVQAALVAVSTLDELERIDCTDTILLLHGEIAREQIMPKNFVFYNPEHHRRIVALLEEKRPAAIVAAPAPNPDVVGALYPYPLFEDGDFDIPSVYMTAREGERLARRTGRHAHLQSQASRIPSTGCSVIARRGDSARRIVVCAHIDAKVGTPGALDDAAGTVTLLLLAQLLSSWKSGLAVEIVALNGEDYYAVPGQMRYLADNEGKLDTIDLAVNLDDLGYRTGRTSYSLYECPEPLAEAVRCALGREPELFEGPQWFQGDHMIFAMNGRPAVAITTEHLGEVMRDVVHTRRDRPELVDCTKLAACAHALHGLLEALSDRATHR
jgi:aminopeptidase YwaD